MAVPALPIGGASFVCSVKCVRPLQRTSDNTLKKSTSIQTKKYASFQNIILSVDDWLQQFALLRSSSDEESTSITYPLRFKIIVKLYGVTIMCQYALLELIYILCAVFSLFYIFHKRLCKTNENFSKILFIHEFEQTKWSQWYSGLMRAPVPWKVLHRRFAAPCGCWLTQH